jgi:hypothetical protein
MTVHNDNKRREEAVLKERRDTIKTLRNEVVTEVWQYSMTAGKGGKGRSTRLF